MPRHENQRAPIGRSRVLRPDAPKGPTRTLGEFAAEVGVTEAEMLMTFARSAKRGDEVPEPVVRANKSRFLRTRGYFLRAELVRWWKCADCAKGASRA